MNCKNNGHSSRNGPKTIGFHQQGWFRCKYCRTFLSTVEELLEHEERHEGNERPYECKLCDKVFISSDNFRFHLVMFHELSKFQCHICSETFPCDDFLIRHMHTIHFYYDCNTCGRNFLTKNLMINHKPSCDHLKEVARYNVKLHNKPNPVQPISYDQHENHFVRDEYVPPLLFENLDHNLLFSSLLTKPTDADTALSGRLIAELDDILAQSYDQFFSSSSTIPNVNADTTPGSDLPIEDLNYKPSGIYSYNQLSTLPSTIEISGGTTPSDLLSAYDLEYNNQVHSHNQLSSSPSTIPIMNAYTTPGSDVPIEDLNYNPSARYSFNQLPVSILTSTVQMSAVTTPSDLFSTDLDYNRVHYSNEFSPSPSTISMNADTFPGSDLPIEDLNYNPSEIHSYNQLPTLPSTIQMSAGTPPSDMLEINLDSNRDYSYNEFSSSPSIIPMTNTDRPTTSSNQVSTKVELIRCKCCHTFFSTTDELVKHEKTHIKNKTVLYDCDICGEKYDKRWELKIHFFEVHEDRRFECRLCLRNFTEKQYLLLHIRDRHSGVECYECFTCKKSFSSFSFMMDHEHEFHSMVKSFKCSHCGMVFLSCKRLLRHKNSEHTDGHKAHKF